MTSPLAEKFLAWYQRQKRSLPWRDNPIPYHVWVAEIMAQQTRLDTMLPYYERWLARFPDIETLAAADEQEVLKLWEGLGYYRRARNLHAAAQLLLAQYDGRLPRTAAELRALPGIGPYTAGAIASVAFGEDEPAVDGNAIRVLSRLFDIQQAPQSSAGKRAFWEAARSILPPGQASDFNQGLMELGARVCTPRNPHCEACPLAEDCQAQALGIQEQRPLRAAPAPLPTRHSLSLVLQQDDQLLLRQRPADALLGGMWEFPNFEISPDLPAPDLPALIQRELGLPIKTFQELTPISHTYSHFHAEVRVLRAYPAHQLAEGQENAGHWLPAVALEDYPMGKIDRAIAQFIIADIG